MNENIYDSIIIGGGPAGLSALLYLGRALTNTLLIEKRGAGGQVMSTDKIENYLGFPKGIESFELVEKMREHAEEFSKNKIEYDEITSIENIEEKIKTVHTADGKEYKTKSIILATGGASKPLGVKGEDKLSGHGVSYCATCDGAFYKGKTVAVVGGGNSAFDESYFLTRFVNKIYLIHRRKEFRADPGNIKMLTDTKKVEYILDSVIEEIYGENKVEGVVVKNLLDNSEKKLSLDGVFVFVGQKPATDFLANSGVKLTNDGLIITDKSMATNIAGVFACGDAVDKPVRQVANAVGEGAVAAVSVTHYIAHL